MAQEKANYAVTMMARVLEVSRSGFMPGPSVAAPSARAVRANRTWTSRSAGSMTAPGVPMVLRESPLTCMMPVWTWTVRRSHGP